jgi:hypothetical protein
MVKGMKIMEEPCAAVNIFEYSHAIFDGCFKKLAILPSGNLGTEDDECVRGTPIFSQTIHYLDY